MKTESHDVVPVSSFKLNNDTEEVTLQGDAYITQNKTSFYDLKNLGLLYIDGSASLQNQSKHAIVSFPCAHPKYSIDQLITLSHNCKSE